MSTEPSLKTKFTYTIIPNTAQYKWAKWDEHLQTVPASTLESAKAQAEKDPRVSYFFHMKSSMVLEQLEGKPSKSFSSGDAAFFSGDNLWLGSAPGMADTYLIAEQYDMSDQTTRESLMQLLRKDFVLNGKSTMSGTKEKPVKVKAGWVFVEFTDVKGGDADSLRKKLEGPGNALKTFVERESNGCVELSTDVYSNPATKKNWVTLSGNHTAYENDFAKIAQDVDAQIEFPNDWDIALFAFPDIDPDPNNATNGNNNLYVQEGGGNYLSTSQCLTGRMVDGSQSIQFAFMDPVHYTDQINAQEPTTHITTIHELMHALDLRDLYDMTSFRSFGWSIMSAAGAGRHITQLEKLLLGWEDPANFIFLKRGLIPSDQLLVQGGIKGIVIMPEGDRVDTYFIEVAQEIGVGKTNLDKFNADNKDDYGLLLMIVRGDRAEGCMIPYVSARPTNALDDEKLYGGASKAPFRKIAKFSTNGIFSYPTPAYKVADSANPMSRLVGVSGNYQAPDRATKLRENEKIVSGDDIFMMSTTGVLGFEENARIPVGDYSLCHKDYGFVAFVDNKGIFKVATSVDENPLQTSQVKSFSPPAGTVLTEGMYYFKIEKDESGQSCVGIYKEGEMQRQYVLFRKPQNTLPRGWKFEQGRSKIVLGNDGNLVVLVDDSFKQGSRQAFGLDKSESKPYTIHFDDNGAMLWFDMWGSQIKRFDPTTAANKPLVKPFKLAVSDPQADHGSLLVTDATGVTLCKVFDY